MMQNDQNKKNQKKLGVIRPKNIDLDCFQIQRNETNQRYREGYGKAFFNLDF